MTGRYVIHLPVATDLPAAQRLARVVARWLLVLPQTDSGRPPSPPRTTRAYAIGSFVTR